MRSDDTKLGILLQNESIPFAERMANAENALQSSTPSVEARAACWMAYRAIDKNNILALPILAHALTRNMFEPDDFLRHRWRMSLYMAYSYSAILSDAEDPSFPLMNLMRYEEGIICNPTGAVNVCRAGVLLAAYHRDFPPEEAIFSCFRAFRLAAKEVTLEKAPTCVGFELLMMSKAVAIAIMLARKEPDAELLSVDQSQPFNRALAHILAKTP